MSEMENQYRQLLQEEKIPQVDFDHMWSRIERDIKPRKKAVPTKKAVLIFSTAFLLVVGTASANYFSKVGQTEINVVSQQELPPPPFRSTEVNEEDAHPDLSMYGTITREESVKLVGTQFALPSYVPEGFQLAFEGGQDYMFVMNEDRSFQKRELIPILKHLYHAIYTNGGVKPDQKQMKDAVHVSYFFYNTEIKSSINMVAEKTKSFTFEGYDAFYQEDVLTVFRPGEKDGLTEIKIFGPIPSEEKEKMMKSLLDGWK
ncbi:hypothetical protein [Ammoniphilus resinae]|uniref:Anti-sigma factor n=1 Tax=Ammoniphilus resinae TaxID=861532 RepID=A0ABS4GUX0_9BACL|nr:hypothetical protein [Ammoniphilus resinae]MBP1934052.1 hypothetical protein [Ammoniphilus resinae]